MFMNSLSLLPTVLSVPGKDPIHDTGILPLIGN